MSTPVIAIVPPEFLGLTRAFSRQELEREWADYLAGGRTNEHAVHRADCRSVQDSALGAFPGVTAFALAEFQGGREFRPAHTSALAHARVPQGNSNG